MNDIEALGLIKMDLLASADSLHVLALDNIERPFEL